MFPSNIIWFPSSFQSFGIWWILKSACTFFPAWFTMFFSRLVSNYWVHSYSILNSILTLLSFIIFFFILLKAFLYIYYALNLFMVVSSYSLFWIGDEVKLSLVQMNAHCCNPANFLAYKLHFSKYRLGNVVALRELVSF